MFIHETHLPQLLSAEHYTSAEQFQRELHEVFFPNWQLAGTTAMIPKEGDYFLLTLFGRPLIIWNSGGEVNTFLNICPHRFSMLTDQPCGNSRDRLVCRYHGWEFDHTGNTCKIPDAKSFRPMSKGTLGLERYHTETAGQLIFVNLSEDPPSLADYLGPLHAVVRELCSEQFTQYHTLDFEVEANWKIKIENALESYHVDMVHSETFGKTPEAERCEHELQPEWSSFTSIEPLERTLDKLVHRLARVEPDLKYRHYLLYPNVMFAKMRLFSWAETILPVTPTRLRIRNHMFCYSGHGRRLSSRLLVRALGRWGRKFFTKSSYEDARILPFVQSGMESAKRPSSGVISVREERCHNFQEYIQRTTCGERPGSKPHLANKAFAEKSRNSLGASLR